MRTLANAVRILVLAIAAGVVASCGGGGGGEAPPDHSPAITNLRYSPTAAVQLSGGTASVDVLVDFSDSGGDVASARMKIGSGADMTVPLPDQGGARNGTSTATFRVPIDIAGKYTFDTWLVDGQSGASNRLSGTFEVMARDVGVHSPSITNLRYSPASAIQAAGGTASVVASVDFADVGGDVVSLRLTTSAGADLTVPLPNTSGVKAGTATGTFVVPTDTAGKYTFEAWLVDAKGSASNRLSGGFEILARATTRDPPTISNLRYTPASVYQSAGGTASIEVTVDFTDAGGNVSSARFMSSTGPDLSVPVGVVRGTTSGTTTARFVVSTAKLGASTFEVWLVDSNGDSSNGLSGTFEVLPVGGTGTWATIASPPHPELLGIASNGRLYVAVGRDGTVMTSPDLASWSVPTTGASQALRSVAMSESRIVAVGDDDAGVSIALTSTDGASWIKTFQSTDCGGAACAPYSQLSKVIWTGTQFVAVGLGRPAGTNMLYALVLTSPDGAFWRYRASQAIAITDEWYYRVPRWVTSVAWSGSTLAMAAVDVDWAAVVWASSDAVAWTVSHDIPGEAVWMSPFFDVAWAGGRFVAIDDTGATGGAPTFASADGVHWEVDRNAADLPQMNAVTGRVGEFLAVGDTYRQTSPDGLTWTVSYHLPGCGKGVLWDGSRYVSVGTSICRSQ